MDRPFADAYPVDYDPEPVRRAARDLAVAVRREDTDAVEKIIWRVAGDDAPGYVVFDLVVESARLTAKMQAE